MGANWIALKKKPNVAYVQPVYGFRLATMNTFDKKEHKVCSYCY